MTPWEIHAIELVNCNCAYGCPCQFNALPTTGTCEAAVGWMIEKGHHGDLSLDGLRAAMTVKWPGAIHQGNGTMQIIIDPVASPAQRKALQTIMTGGDTEDMATMWWVFSMMSPNKLETLFLPVEISADPEARRGKVRVAGVFEIEAEPIRNPVTGAEHRARIDLPNGFEFTQAEVANGRTTTEGAISLKNNTDTHAHFARLRLSHKGVFDRAA